MLASLLSFGSSVVVDGEEHEDGDGGDDGREKLMCEDVDVVHVVVDKIGDEADEKDAGEEEKEDESINEGNSQGGDGEEEGDEEEEEKGWRGRGGGGCKGMERESQTFTFDDSANEVNDFTLFLALTES